jgi:branched-chain amino acid transport system substrate-binding protein
MRRIAIIGLALTLIVVAAGCGQKPGVAQGPLPTQPVSLDLPEGAHVDPQTGHIVDAQGNVIGDASSLGISQGGVRASEAQDAAEAEDSTAPLETSSNGPPSGGNATGVTDDVIRIGAHAPLTGAAPVPSDSAQKGNDLFYRWLQEMEKPINGRHVEAILKDDNYNPSQAIAVCKEMVEKDRVFLLYGFAGTDQIQACARYAASVAVPYVSVGVTESGLRGLPGYFAISRTYSEQAPLLADLLASDLGAKGEKNGMLWSRPRISRTRTTPFSPR